MATAVLIFIKYEMFFVDWLLHFLFAFSGKASLKSFLLILKIIYFGAGSSKPGHMAEFKPFKNICRNIHKTLRTLNFFSHISVGTIFIIIHWFTFLKVNSEFYFAGSTRELCFEAAEKIVTVGDAIKQLSSQ